MIKFNCKSIVFDSHYFTNNTRTSYSMCLSSGCSSTRTHALYFMLTNYYSMTVLPMLGKFTPRIHVLTLLRNRRSFPSVTPLQLPTFPRPPLFCACLHQVNHCTPHCIHRYKRRTCSSSKFYHYRALRNCSSIQNPTLSTGS